MSEFLSGSAGYFFGRVCIMRTARTRKNKGIKIGPLKSGELKKYGYSLKSRATMRHSALKKSVKAYGRGTLIKKLNALRVLHKNRYPIYSDAALNDMKYVQRNF